jgi:hypothetical protein
MWCGVAAYVSDICHIKTKFRLKDKNLSVLNFPCRGLMLTHPRLYTSMCEFSQKKQDHFQKMPCRRKKIPEIIGLLENRKSYALKGLFWVAAELVCETICRF